MRASHFQTNCAFRSPSLRGHLGRQDGREVLAVHISPAAQERSDDRALLAASPHLLSAAWPYFSRSYAAQCLAVDRIFVNRASSPSWKPREKSDTYWPRSHASSPGETRRPDVQRQRHLEAHCAARLTSNLLPAAPARVSRRVDVRSPASVGRDDEASTNNAYNTVHALAIRQRHCFSHMRTTSECRSLLYCAGRAPHPRSPLPLEA